MTIELHGIAWLGLVGDSTLTLVCECGTCWTAQKWAHSNFPDDGIGWTTGEWAKHRKFARLSSEDAS